MTDGIAIFRKRKQSLEKLKERETSYPLNQWTLIVIKQQNQVRYIKNLTQV